MIFLNVSIFANINVLCLTKNTHIRVYAKQTVLFELDQNDPFFIPRNVQVFRTQNNKLENSTPEGQLDSKTNQTANGLLKYNITGFQTGELMDSDYNLSIPTKNLPTNFESELEIMFDHGNAGNIHLVLNCVYN
jgi:hypothetical protein